MLRHKTQYNNVKAGRVQTLARRTKELNAHAKLMKENTFSYMSTSINKGKLQTSTDEEHVVNSYPACTFSFVSDSIIFVPRSYTVSISVVFSVSLPTLAPYRKPWRGVIKKINHILN